MYSKNILTKEEFLESGFSVYFHNKEMKECPFCGYEYIHIENISIYRETLDSVVRITNNDPPQIGSPHKIHDELYTQCEKRGTTIMTSYWCENGEHWVHIENFHKGLIFYADVFLEKKQINENFIFEELWRD